MGGEAGPGSPPTLRFSRRPPTVILGGAPGYEDKNDGRREDREVVGYLREESTLLLCGAGPPRRYRTGTGGAAVKVGTGRRRGVRSVGNDDRKRGRMRRGPRARAPRTAQTLIVDNERAPSSRRGELRWAAGGSGGRRGARHSSCVSTLMTGQDCAATSAERSDDGGSVRRGGHEQDRGAPAAVRPVSSGPSPAKRSCSRPRREARAVRSASTRNGWPPEASSAWATG